MARFIEKEEGYATEMLSFFIPGNPVPQPRPRAARIGGHIRMYEPKHSKEWKLRVELATAVAMKKARVKEITDQPVALSLMFFFKRPKSHYTSKGALTKRAPEHHLNRKDIDNAAKGVMDGLRPIIPDDKIVTTLNAEKHWEKNAELGPGVFVRVIW